MHMMEKKTDEKSPKNEKFEREKQEKNKTHLSLPLTISSSQKKEDRKRSEFEWSKFVGDTQKKSVIACAQWKLGNDLMLAIKFD